MGDGLDTRSFLTFNRTTSTRRRLTVIPHFLGGHWELISIHQPPQQPTDPHWPPVLHYHTHDSMYLNNNTTATASPPPLDQRVCSFICQAYNHPITTTFSVGTQFPTTAARQVGGMDCGVFTVRAAMHVIADVPFTQPAPRRGSSRTRHRELDLSYGRSLTAWRAEMFLSVLLFRAPPDEDAPHPSPVDWAEPLS